MRCCDCQFRKDCKHRKNDLTAFERCHLRDCILAAQLVAKEASNEQD